MKCGAFVGATMYEAYIGRLWITITKPKYFMWEDLINVTWFPVKIGWDNTEDES